jgi:hypothetical protein
LLDNDANDMTEKDNEKKKKLRDLMITSLRSQEFSDNEQVVLGLKKSKLDDEDLDLLMEDDNSALNENQLNKKKKLMDIGKRKLKTKTLEEDELELLGVKKSTFKIDSDGKILL